MNLDLSDFDLCDKVFGEITSSRPPKTEISSYNLFERTVVLVWHYSGIIENGGFEAFFSRRILGDDDLQCFAKAFKDIGCYETINAAMEWYRSRAFSNYSAGLIPLVRPFPFANPFSDPELSGTDL